MDRSRAVGELAGVPIDERVLDKHTGADESLKVELLALFVRQSEALHDLVEENPDADTLARALHRLKGAARAVGAHLLEPCLTACEDELEAARRVSPSTRTALQRAILDLGRFCRMRAGWTEGDVLAKSPESR